MWWLSLGPCLRTKTICGDPERNGEHTASHRRTQSDTGPGGTAGQAAASRPALSGALLSDPDHRDAGDAVERAGLDAVAGNDAPDGLLGCDHVYALAGLRHLGCAPETRQQRIHQLLSWG